ncbi:MAG: flagellar biosynthetic protein FliO [Treponemataceae bacterium]|nr:flagellar biosynthetic protein FliO [Treponemataceae bacterium]
MILSVCPLYAQSQNESTALTELQEKENEAFSNMFSETNENNGTERREPNTFWLFFRTLLVLILVVVAIYFIFKFVKKSTNVGGNDKDPYLKKVASVSLAAGKSVQVVTLQDHCYVLGVGDDAVTLISELDMEKDKELIASMNINKDSEPTKTRKDFATIFASVMGVKKNKNEDNLKSSLFSLHRQSDRLQKREKSDEDQ